MSRSTSLAPLFVGGGLIAILGFATFLWMIPILLPTSTVLPPPEDFDDSISSLYSFAGYLTLIITGPDLESLFSVQIEDGNSSAGIHEIFHRAWYYNSSGNPVQVIPMEYAATSAVIQGELAINVKETTVEVFTPISKVWIDLKISPAVVFQRGTPTYIVLYCNRYMALEQPPPAVLNWDSIEVVSTSPTSDWFEDCSDISDWTDGRGTDLESTTFHDHGLTDELLASNGTFTPENSWWNPPNGNITHRSAAVYRKLPTSWNRILIKSTINFDPGYSNESFNGTLALEHARYQCEEIGFRAPGSPGIEKTRVYISNTIKQLPGWTISFQNFTYKRVSAVNVIADWSGNTTTRPDGVTLLGAHYDTRYIADKDRQQPTAPVLGANDGASGVAVLLELARVIERQNLSMDIRLVFFDAEDQGSGGMPSWDWIVGSQYYADYLEDNNLVDGIKRMFLVDMIGDTDLQIYKEFNSDSDLTEEIWAVAAEIGATSFRPNYKYRILDDHLPFKNLGIPSVDIIDFDYPYHHTTNDTFDKISDVSLSQVGKTIETFLKSISEEMNGFNAGGISLKEQIAHFSVQIAANTSILLEPSYEFAFARPRLVLTVLLYYIRY